MCKALWSQTPPSTTFGESTIHSLLCDVWYICHFRTYLGMMTQLCNIPYVCVYYILWCFFQLKFRGIMFFGLFMCPSVISFFVTITLITTEWISTKLGTSIECKTKMNWLYFGLNMGVIFRSMLYGHVPFKKKKQQHLADNLLSLKHPMLFLFYLSPFSLSCSVSSLTFNFRCDL